MRTALVTGVAGQDGTYLARSLLADGVRVVGIVRTPMAADDARQTYLSGVELRVVDLCDSAAVRGVVDEVEPDEVYNLAAMSSVGRSWQEPELAFRGNQDAVEVLVAALRAQRDRTGRASRLFQASSAEVSSDAAASPYAQSKAAAEEVVRDARSRGLHASIGRLYIHESPLRAPGFVSRKVTRGAAAIALGLQESLTLGNLDVVRDWGFAGEYVEAIRLLTASEEPTDLPIGSGRAHSLTELVDRAFVAAGLAGSQGYIDQDPGLARPADTAVLVADPEPAADAIGWRATSTLEDVIDHMVSVDLARLRTGVAESVAYLAAS